MLFRVNLNVIIALETLFIKIPVSKALGLCSNHWQLFFCRLFSARNASAGQFASTLLLKTGTTSPRNLLILQPSIAGWFTSACWRTKGLLVGNFVETDARLINNRNAIMHPFDVWNGGKFNLLLPIKVLTNACLESRVRSFSTHLPLFNSRKLFVLRACRIFWDPWVHQAFSWFAYFESSVGRKTKSNHLLFEIYCCRTFQFSVVFNLSFQAKLALLLLFTTFIKPSFVFILMSELRKTWIPSCSLFGAILMFFASFSLSFASLCTWFFGPLTLWIWSQTTGWPY